MLRHIVSRVCKIVAAHFLYLNYTASRLAVWSLPFFRLWPKFDGGGSGTRKCFLYLETCHSLLEIYSLHNLDSVIPITLFEHASCVPGQRAFELTGSVLDTTARNHSQSLSTPATIMSSTCTTSIIGDLFALSLSRNKQGLQWYCSKPIFDNVYIR